MVPFGRIGAKGASTAQYAIGREWFDCSTELVRAAYEEAYKDLVVRRHQQEGWEKMSAERAEGRRVPLGRPRKNGDRMGNGL